MKQPDKPTPEKKRFVYQQFGMAAKVPSPQPGRVSGVKVIGWGKDNLYPNQLINLYEESPLHGGLINGKVHYEVAGGLKYTGADQEKWILANKNFESDYTIEESMDEISRDLELFNAFAYKGKWRIGGNGVILEHVNMDELRKGDPKEHEVTTWYRCSDWSDMKKARNAKPYPEFDPAVQEGEFMFVYMAKSKRPKEKMNGRKLIDTPYPFPPYSSGIRAIMTDIEIAKFDLSEVQNGWTSGTHMHFSDGIPDDEDRAQLEREIRDGQTGAEAAGNISITWSDGDSKKPVTITSLMGNNQPERYNKKIEVIADRILQAHSATSGLLFGIKVPGQIGGSEELEVSYDIMKANYFAKRKATIVEAIEYLMKSIYGLTGTFQLADVPLGELAGVEGEEGSQVAEVSLNGAQITGLIAILEQVSLGLINKDAGLSMIRAAFPSIPSSTVEEILSGTKVGAAKALDPSMFSDKIEHTILSSLLKCGTHRKEFEVVQSQMVQDHTQLEAMESELLKAHQFAPNLSQQAASVLTLINNGDSFDSIRKALDIQSSLLAGIYNDLAAEGLIDPDSGEVTPEGKQIAEDDAPQIGVRYSYEKRPDVSGPDILPNGRTREFCATLIRADRFYTREEIDRISMQTDRNVWLFKGGWYHNPENDRNEPYCRHTWVQNLVSL